MRTLISVLAVCLCPVLWAQQYATILYRQTEAPRAVHVAEIDSVVVRDVAEVDATYFDTPSDTVYVVQTRESHTGTVSVPMDVYMDKANDMLGARVFTFGIPGCNPYDDASVASAPEGKHFLVLNVTYVNGSWRNIRADVTDQIRALPLGGVVTIEIDVNDFPPDESAGGGGGFDALIGDWDEEEASTTIIY